MKLNAPRPATVIWAWTALGMIVLSLLSLTLLRAVFAWLRVEPSRPAQVGLLLGSVVLAIIIASLFVKISRCFGDRKWRRELLAAGVSQEMLDRLEELERKEPDILYPDAQDLKKLPPESPKWMQYTQMVVTNFKRMPENEFPKAFEELENRVPPQGKKLEYSALSH